MKHLGILMVTGLILGCGSGAILQEEENANTTQEQEARFEVSSGKTVPIFSNVTLTQSDANKTRAILIIHGTDRNAKEYYDTIKKIVDDANKSTSTIVVAPHFQQTGDTGLNGDELAWSSTWREGGSTPEGNISSYTVMDALIKAINTQFNKVTTIVIAGHSAGGQFVQRYAAFTQVDGNVTDKNLSFVAANPGSYMYFHTLRPEANASCGKFNEYKYGLANRSGYMNSIESNATILAHYAKRYVTYFLGEADTNTSDPALDTGCEAMMQGAHRFERGKNYYAYFDGNVSDHNHTEIKVPNVGHTRTGMFGSTQGKKLLLGE